MYVLRCGGCGTEEPVVTGYDPVPCPRCQVEREIVYEDEESEDMNKDQFLAMVGIRLQGMDLTHDKFKPLSLKDTTYAAFQFEKHADKIRWYVDRDYYNANKDRMMVLHREIQKRLRTLGYRWKAIHTSMGAEFHTWPESK